jgi:hypothetical protein
VFLVDKGYKVSQQTLINNHHQANQPGDPLHGSEQAKERAQPV